MKRGSIIIIRLAYVPTPRTAAYLVQSTGHLFNDKKTSKNKGRLKLYRKMINSGVVIILNLV